VVGRIISGEEAILKAAELEPDLIMMDINLGGVLDGVETARYLFQLFRFPIIFLTGQCDDSLLKRARGAQPYGFIMKPFTDKELNSNVDLALYNHSIRKKFLEIGPIGTPKKIMPLLDPVIVTDTHGRIIFFNNYTERFFDLPANQILMRYWRDVMMFVNDQTDEQLEDPVKEVLGQMVAITHEFNVAVVSRSGKRRKISLNIRPVKDDQDELIGVLIHIKEKSLGQIKMATNIMK
jgi:PAS domain S-box-containing protein